MALHYIEDLGIANGTLLNGEPITEAIELKDKDLIDTYEGWSFCL